MCGSVFRDAEWLLFDLVSLEHSSRTAAPIGSHFISTLVTFVTAIVLAPGFVRVPPEPLCIN